MSIPGHIRVYYVPSQARRLAKNEAKKSAKQPPTINLDSQKKGEGAAGGVKKGAFSSPGASRISWQKQKKPNSIRAKRSGNTDTPQEVPWTSSFSRVLIYKKSFIKVDRRKNRSSPVFRVLLLCSSCFCRITNERGEHIVFSKTFFQPPSFLVFFWTVDCSNYVGGAAFVVPALVFLLVFMSSFLLSNRVGGGEKTYLGLRKIPFLLFSFQFGAGESSSRERKRREGGRKRRRRSRIELPFLRPSWIFFFPLEILFVQFTAFTFRKKEDRNESYGEGSFVLGNSSCAGSRKPYCLELAGADSPRQCAKFVFSILLIFSWQTVWVLLVKVERQK